MYKKYICIKKNLLRADEEGLESVSIMSIPSLFNEQTENLDASLNGGIVKRIRIWND